MLRPILIIILASILFACAQGGAVPNEPDIEGMITQADGGILLIEENPEEKSGSPKAYVRITEETDLVDTEGRSVRLDDVTAGMRARAWFSGPVMESYPLQATAERVAVQPGGER